VIRPSEDLVRRVTRGEPAAMRDFFENTICRPNGITWTYSAARDWCAWPARKVLRVPPPIDRAALAICLHEAAHCVNGPCPNTGLHRTTKDGCLECESSSWITVDQWLPPNPIQFQRKRTALATYTTLLAPLAAQHRAAETMSTLTFGLDYMRRMRWDDRVEKTQRALRDAHQKTPLQLKIERTKQVMRDCARRTR
jgi:hypothetical protein